jgi:hypothetical protein
MPPNFFQGEGTRKCSYKLIFEPFRNICLRIVDLYIQTQMAAYKKKPLKFCFLYRVWQANFHFWIWNAIWKRKLACRILYINVIFIDELDLLAACKKVLHLCRLWQNFRIKSICGKKFSISILYIFCTHYTQRCKFSVDILWFATDKPTHSLLTATLINTVNIIKYMKTENFYVYIPLLSIKAKETNIITIHTKSIFWILSSHYCCSCVHGNMTK